MARLTGMGRVECLVRELVAREFVAGLAGVDLGDEVLSSAVRELVLAAGVAGGFFAVAGGGGDGLVDDGYGGVGQGRGEGNDGAEQRDEDGGEESHLEGSVDSGSYLRRGVGVVRGRKVRVREGFTVFVGGVRA